MRISPLFLACSLFFIGLIPAVVAQPTGARISPDSLWNFYDINAALSLSSGNVNLTQAMLNSNLLLFHPQWEAEARALFRYGQLNQNRYQEDYALDLRYGYELVAQPRIYAYAQMGYFRSFQRRVDNRWYIGPGIGGYPWRTARNQVRIYSSLLYEYTKYRLPRFFPANPFTDEIRRRNPLTLWRYRIEARGMHALVEDRLVLSYDLSYRTALDALKDYQIRIRARALYPINRHIALFTQFHYQYDEIVIRTTVRKDLRWMIGIHIHGGAFFRSQPQWMRGGRNFWGF